jgi:hypothetical protein
VAVTTGFRSICDQGNHADDHHWLVVHCAWHGGCVRRFKRFVALAKFCSFATIRASGCLAWTSVFQANFCGGTQAIYLWVFVPKWVCLVRTGVSRFIFILYQLSKSDDSYSC